MKKNSGLLLQKKIVNWALAEQLAFGALMQDGYSVRLSGQDVQRGTFNQRHAAYTHLVTEKLYIPLNNIKPYLEGGKHGPRVGRFDICNSTLSEAAVLGFEYGYNLASPSTMCVWEAQFGDFANLAQGIIDTFVVSGQEKWNQTSRLVMALPHGYDGQGPDHSNARMERYLQMCNDDADWLPGESPAEIREIDKGFDEADVNKDGVISIDEMKILVNSFKINAKGYDVKLQGDKWTRDLQWRQKWMLTEADELITSDVNGMDPPRSSSSVGDPLDRSMGPDPCEELNDDDHLTSDDLKTIKSDHFSAGQIQQILSLFRDENGNLKEHITKEEWTKGMTEYFRFNHRQSTHLVVASCASPANYFHLLRRQMMDTHAVPLIVFISKHLMHHGPCQSPLTEIGEGTKFQRAILDDTHRPVLQHQLTRLVFCTGQIYYKLRHALNFRNSSFRRDYAEQLAKVQAGTTTLSTITEELLDSEHEDFVGGDANEKVVFLRLEQISPFPYEEVLAVLLKYPCANLIWAQEEPKNMGAWNYVRPRLRTCVRSLKDYVPPATSPFPADSPFSSPPDSTVQVVHSELKSRLSHQRAWFAITRLPSSSSATGSYSIHLNESDQLINQALGPLKLSYQRLL